MIPSTASVRARSRAASLLFASALVATLMIPNFASAQYQKVEFNMDTVFSGDDKSSPGDLPWINVTFESTTPGTVTMTVNNNFVDDPDSDENNDFLQTHALFVNFDPDLDINLLDLVNTSDDAFTWTSGVNTEKADGTGGDFDIEIQFAGSSKLLAGETTVFVFTSSEGITASSFNFANNEGYYVASHIHESDSSGGSTWVGAVPEPASVVMLGMSSLVGLGYAWRKRKRAVA